MGDMDDLAAWLEEQIAEDELRAQAVDPSKLEALSRQCGIDLYEHLYRWEPRRMLAECEAKRRIIALHSHTTVYVWHDRSRDFECGLQGVALVGDARRAAPEKMPQGCAPWPCDTIRLLTLPYVDRPGFREEWRVTDSQISTDIVSDT